MIFVTIVVLLNSLYIINIASAAEDKSAFAFTSGDIFPGKISFSQAPGDLPGQYGINHVYPVCKDVKDSDCIMSVEFINKDGKKVSGKLLEYIPAEFRGHWGINYKGKFTEASEPPYFYPTSKDIVVKGNVKKKIPDGSRSSIWSFPGLSHEGGDKYLVTIVTNASVTNEEVPNADNSIANWQDGGTLLSITPLKVDNDTSGLEITREVFEFGADGKTLVSKSLDLLAKYGYASNLEKVCYVSPVRDKPNCYSQARDSQYPRFKISLRLKLTEDFLSVRHWFTARAAGIKVTSKKEGETSIVTFEGTTVKVPAALALLPKTIEGYKIYRSAVNKSFADGGAANEPLDLNDLSGFSFWQSLSGSAMQSTDPGSLAFWSAIEPFSTVLVEERSPTWSFQTATILGRDAGWLWPCVTRPHISGAIASNASIMKPSPPSWNAEKQTLEFRIASPHLNQDRSVAEGFYNLSVSQEVANCLWGGDASKSKAEISIISDAGEKKIFVSSTGSSDGYINFQVSGFTYSVNTISLKLLKDVSTIPTVKSTSPKEITCKKGKITKKLKAKKCPTGYIKK